MPKFGRRCSVSGGMVIVLTMPYVIEFVGYRRDVG
jgi:hypothetical protein